MIRNKAQVQNYLLQKLKSSSADILEIDLVSKDGLILVSTSRDSAYRDKVAALAASVFRPAQKAAVELPFEGVNFVVISGGKQNLYLKEVGEDQLLAVIVKAGADWESIQRQITKTTGDLQYIADMKGKIEDRLG